MAPSTPPSDGRKRPDQGKDLTSYIDKVLDGVDGLGSDTKMQKSWHLTNVPDLELAELSISFPDFAQGMIDTDGLCEVSAAEVEVEGLCQHLDAQDSSSVSITAGRVVGWDSLVSAESYTSAGSQAPFPITRGGLDFIDFRGSQTMAEQNVTNSCVSRPGSAPWTMFAVWAATNTGFGFIWGYATDRRWNHQVVGSTGDLRIAIDDNTTVQFIDAADATFNNDDVYITVAQRDDPNLRIYWGNGGSLAESSSSPLNIGTYGSLTQPTNAHIGSTGSGGNFLDGAVGELRFYDRALSLSEITTVYNLLVSKWSAAL